MANPTEFHQEFSLLPATKFRALEIGETYYFTGKRCSKNHLSPRYASSGNCVECIAEARGKAKINKRGKSSIRSDENQKLALKAVENGFTEYESTKPCPSGHYTRYVTTNNCVTCAKERQKNRNDYCRWLRIKKEYGITKDQVFLMLENQKNECEICKTSLLNGYHIDHCHKTNKVRGLLCQKCNQAIGLLKEDESLFFRAAQYIRDNNGIKTVPKTSH